MQEIKSLMLNIFLRRPFKRPSTDCTDIRVVSIFSSDSKCQTIPLTLLLLYFNVNSRQSSECLTHLIHELQIREEGDVLGPLYSAEEQPRRQLANVLDAHQVVSLHALGAIAGCGVGLGTQQQRNEARQVGLAVVRVSAVG